ncbi:MAG: serine hydrolase domain-containing protein [Cyanobacteria bacterium P01_E01_bin.42]
MKMFGMRPYFASFGLVILLFLLSCTFDDRVTQLQSNFEGSITTGNNDDRNAVTDPDLSPAIDELVTETLVKNGPGVAVLVISDGQILHDKGYGFRDVEKQLLITVNTAFDLASVSKQMTAMGILILMEAGELEIEDPVSDYLPDFVDLNPNNPILITDLLYHTSGLADYTGDDWEGSDREFSQLTLEKHLEWINRQNIYSDRGQTFVYNNSGYALLALIIQRVSGQDFSTFMKENIFDSLEMNDTVVFHRLGQTIRDRAKGYRISNQGAIETSSFPSAIAGDGNIFSSIADLAKYDEGLRKNKLISPDALALVFTSGMLDNGEMAEDYGLGWEITDEYAHHGGSWDGTSTYYRYYTNRNGSIVVLSNDENYDPETLADEIFELMRSHF